MPFSLLAEPWIPARRASGVPVTIRPCDITDAFDPDPIVALAWPRPDFRLAGLEWLIGLLATACPPSDLKAWLSLYRAPPAPAVLATAFAPLERAFVLDGDGPRFLQDFEPFGGESNRIETLLIDAPGSQTLKKNADHFVKRDAVTSMSRAAAAMALFTLQCFAPAGGAGNRVGLRGGGPLTTLALPPHDGPLPLWRLLWANVPIGQVPDDEQLSSVFPWLAPTRTSEGARTTSPTEVHPSQVFWGMPRRIRLEFSENAVGAPCGITGVIDSIAVRGWRQRPNGVNYAKWLHPLSPYYRQKITDAEWLPVHAQPGRVGYRHWIGLLLRDTGETRRPAPAVLDFSTNRLSRTGSYAERINWRLLAAGYDMDNMKARGFVESELPVVQPGDPERMGDFVELIQQLVAAASEAAGLLGRSVRRALFSDGAKVALDAGVFSTLRERFWAETEPAFQQRVAEAAGAGEAEPLRRAWLADLAGKTRTLFAEAAPIDAMGADRRPDRIAAAAKGLSLALAGYGKDGQALFKTLGLLPPETAAKARLKLGKSAA